MARTLFRSLTGVGLDSVATVIDEASVALLEPLEGRRCRAAREAPEDAWVSFSRPLP